MRRTLSKGNTKRSPDQQVALAVRILDETHIEDVLQKAIDTLGERGGQIGPMDTAQNLLASYVDRFRVYRTPPLVSGLTEELSALIGDWSASVTVDRYATADGRPMPTEQIKATMRAMRYRLGAGFAGVLLSHSERSGLLTLQPLKPTEFRPEYASDDPSEPVRITHFAKRVIGEKSVEVEEVYDLTDMEHPSYRVFKGDQDITVAVHGRSFDGDDYLWRFADGRPFHRIPVTGHPDNVYVTNALLEATLTTSVRWTAWGSGTDHASHPQRNVRGLALAHSDSSAETQQSGQAVGPERVVEWVDMNPDTPGEHWQDAPAYDPLTLARAIRVNMTSVLSFIGLPIDFEGTGGDPTEQERKALLEFIAMAYPEQRRFDATCLQRLAAMANRLGSVEGDSHSEGPYGILYREEVGQALASAAETMEREENSRGEE